jgi:hypothetical protein
MMISIFIYFRRYKYKSEIVIVGYGHTLVKTPEPVRSPKLSTSWLSQYCGGGPHGNTGCCSFIHLCFFCWLRWMRLNLEEKINFEKGRAGARWTLEFWPDKPWVAREREQVGLESKNSGRTSPEFRGMKSLIQRVLAAQALSCND